MSAFVLAIVGGGPSCTYVLERLAATAAGARGSWSLDVHVFERTGEFGSGAVHSVAQPASSILNRIAVQVGFAADESVAEAGPLLPARLRRNLYEWSRQQFAQTSDPAFDLQPESWPQRRIHGLALQHAFRTYQSILESMPSIRLRLHANEVTDVRITPKGYAIVVAQSGGAPLLAHEVLFLTGHSVPDPQMSQSARRMADFAKQAGGSYVPYAYPLERAIALEDTGPAKAVGIQGMGLTAIDVILFLTEGRGGRFESGPDPARLTYRPSGREPLVIVPFSRTGLFTFSRPFNAKAQDPSRLEHQPVFLTRAAIDRLRRAAGRPLEIRPFGIRYQLDFERHILPLVRLEMASIYYKTLLGDDFARHVLSMSRDRYEAFLAGVCADATPEEAAVFLLEPIETAVTEAFALIEARLKGSTAASAAPSRRLEWDFEAGLERYRQVVFGTEAESLPTHSPHGHSITAQGNRFSWQRLVSPISAADCSCGDRYRDAVIAFMDRDHLWSSQNNVLNPYKAATDGVWRDLRQVLAYAIDFGGLTASSHQTFLNVYMRHHNRLANGASLEIMRKIQALILSGLVDISIGPGATASTDQTGKRFVVRADATGAERQLDTVIDAKVHAFDPEKDQSPLYRNMLRSGIIRKWRNPSVDGPGFEPGGLDLDAKFHPIDARGRSDSHLTFFGPPSEGVMFFQLGALRPHVNHHVIHDILSWVRELWQHVETCGALPASSHDCVGMSGMQRGL